MPMGVAIFVTMLTVRLCLPSWFMSTRRSVIGLNYIKSGEWDGLGLNESGTLKDEQMYGRMHDCGKCGGSLVLSYDCWSCFQCGRKFFLRNGRAEEMWWKNKDLEFPTSAPLATH